MKNKIVGFLNNSTTKQDSPTQQRGGFEDDEQNDAKPVIKKGINLTNANSSINTPTPSFNITENAKAILVNQELKKRTAVELTMAMISLFKDKTLDENKDPERKKAESKILLDYIDFAKILNSAEDEEPDSGTFGTVLALMKINLIQKNRINELEYEIKTLSKKLDQVIKNK